MGLSFLAPFLLAGTALISIPWLLHHIRRPEREPVQFSSLLFVPNIKKEVIERRRIQHLLLLLLRMLIFFILFYSFARPYWSTTVQPEINEQSSVNVILLDVSYSMMMDNRFETAKQSAQSIIHSLSSKDYVSVMPFSFNPKAGMEIELGKISPAKSHEEAIKQLELIEPVNETTRFIPALQEAERQLLNLVQGMEDNEPQLVIHLISDFQREGLPKEATGWKLSSKIELKTAHLQEAYQRPNNISILDSNVRDQIDTYRVVGKVKNWTDQDQTVEVDLWLSNEKSETRSVFIKAGNASQIFFTVPKTLDKPLIGWLQTKEDSLAVDNRRYVVRNPTIKFPVEIVTSKNDRTTSSAWFIYQALTHNNQLPWDVKPVPHTDVQFDRESIYIISDWDESNAAFVTSLKSQIETGLSAIMLLDDSMSVDELNSVLSSLGLQSNGLNHNEFNARRYTLISSIEFEHPVFHVFQGQQFNDFSPIRFYRYHQLAEHDSQNAQDADITIKTLAGFESGDDGVKYPALVEVLAGKSRVLILPYSLQLDWTNLPKSKKFVPLLHEMLYYLQGESEVKESWTVGDDIALAPGMDETENVTVQYPVQKDGGMIAFPDFTTKQYDQPGIMQMQSMNQNETVEASYAINIDSSETDIEPVPRDEFVLRYCAAPNLEENTLEEDQIQLANEEVVQKHEYGIFLVAALFGLLMLEMWYASQLT